MKVYEDLPKTKRITAIIVNYKTYKLTLDCLKALIDQLDFRKDLVIIVDNGSSDVSVDKFKDFINEREISSYVKIRELPSNVGFSESNNIAIKENGSEFYLLLNTDVILKERCIEKLFNAINERSNVGLIAPRLEWPDGRAQVNARRFLKPINEFISASGTGLITRLFKDQDVIMPIPNEPAEAEWISFSCVMIKKEVIDSVGLLEKYFMYFDDIDYCRRAWGKGLKVLYWPEARAVHLKGSSSKIHSCARKPNYYYESRAKYFAKFYGITGLWLANILWELGRLISLFRELLGNKKPHTRKYEWLDIWTNCFNPMRRSKYL